MSMSIFRKNVNVEFFPENCNVEFRPKKYQRWIFVFFSKMSRTDFLQLHYLIFCMEFPIVEIFWQKSKMLTKIEIFDKNRNFWQKSKFLTKIEIFHKNRNFSQKSKFFTNIEIFHKNLNVEFSPASLLSINYPN